MSNPNMVDRLYEAFLGALAEVEKEHTFTRGDAMSAAVHVLVDTGLCQHGDTVERLMRETNEAMLACIRERQAGIQ